MYGYIYLTTNLINGKKYLGKHIAKSIEDSYIGSGTLLRRAIAKYGADNFKKEVLQIANDAAELSRQEIETILEHNAVADPTYYNIAAGGSGGATRAGYSEQELADYKTKMLQLWANMSEEQKLQHAKKTKDMWANMSKEQKLQHTKKIGEMHKGRPKSEDHKQKISEAKKGKSHLTLETRLAYSQRRKAEVAAGINVPPVGNRGNKDFRHTQQSKQQMSESLIEAHHRAIEERGAYLTPEGLENFRLSWASLTPERRQRFAEETKNAVILARQAQKKNADDFAERFAPIIRDMQYQGLKIVEIAERLNALGHRSPRGGPWTDQTIRQVLKRIPPPPKLFIGWDHL